MDDFSKYESMRDTGASSAEVYRTAKAGGLDSITILRLLRNVFALSVSQAKEVMVIAEGAANSLEQYQENLIPCHERALAQASDDRTTNWHSE